jgi:phage tail sheath protein FI
MAYLHPGVYVEEIPSGSKPIEGVGTSTAAFVGFTTKGPIGEPELIFKWDDYYKKYGGIRNLQKEKKGDPMGLSVAAFFQNGGTKAYIVRITDAAANASAKKAVGYLDNPLDRSTGNALEFSAINEGKWANGIVVKMSVSTIDSAAYDVQIGRETEDERGNKTFNVEESFPGVSLDRNDPQFISNVIDGVSDLVTVKLAAIPAGVTSDEYLGTSTGADMTGVSLDFSTLSAANRKLRLTIDTGSGADNITLPKNDYADLNEVAAAIESQVRALTPSDVRYTGFTCRAINNKLVLTSGTREAISSVVVDETIGIAGTLRLGLDPAVSYIATSTSGDLTGVSLDFSAIANAADRTLSGSVDGVPFELDLGIDPFANLAALAVKISGIGGLSCAAVGNTLVLTSSAHTASSAVVINSDLGIAPTLKLGVLPSKHGGAEQTGQQYHEQLLSVGTSTSNNLTGVSLDFSAIANAADRTLSGSVDGVPFELDLGIAPFANLAALAVKISEITTLTCAAVGETFVLTPVTAGQAVLIDSTTNIAQVLKLGVANGGVELNANNLDKNLRAEVSGQQQADVTLPQDALDGGTDGSLPGEADYVKVFTKFIKIRDINIICLPGQHWSSDGTGNSVAIIQKAIGHAERMKNRMVIVDLPPTYELETAKMVIDMGLPSQTYCVVYYPWVEAANRFYHAERHPGLPKNVLVPPSSYAAGMWAKTDSRRGVWKAPAGMATGLLGVSKLEHTVEDDEQDSLNPLGVNCLRSMPGAGKVIWGARTRATKADPEWRYVPVRRTAIMIEQSIYEGIQWAVFEPNDHRLWSALRANIGNFMNGLFRVGAFQGEKASDAYFVRCKLGDTMTQGEIDAGQVIVIVGFAPLKPAEFVIVRIQQKVNQQ